MKLKFDFVRILKHINKATFSPTKLYNRLQIIKCYRQHNPVVRAYPSVLQIETTSQCTLKCIMCPRKTMNRKPGHMKMDVYRKLIDQSCNRSEIAILHFMGDPLLNPLIYDMVRYCRNADIRTIISTNGVSLTEEASQKILDSGLDIIILSFDGATKNIFEQTRVGANFEKVAESYKLFLDMQKKNSHKIRTIIQMIDFKTTESEKEQFVELWEKSKADVIVKPFTRWQGDNVEINELSSPDTNGLESNLCDRIWQWLTVTDDGTVVPCCRDYDATVQLGNVNDQSVEEIWNGPLFTEFRRNHLKGRSKLKICSNCDYKAVLDSGIAQMGEIIFDRYALVSLMYDLRYHAE